MLRREENKDSIMSSDSEDDDFILAEDYIIMDTCEPINENSTSELCRKDVDEEEDDLCGANQLVLSSQQNRMRIALEVLVRLIAPLRNGVARGWRGIRGVRLLKALKNIRASREILTNMLAFAANTISMSLSSVQVVHRIDPILKIIKLKKGPSGGSISGTSCNQSPDLILNPSRAIASERDEPEKCVTINVLAEPPPGMPIRADVIFIHGLHGSLVNTWKQGLWNKEGRRVKFERPPRPPVRPPKRPRHSRCSLYGPPHSKKRARYCSHENGNDEKESHEHKRQLTYECDEPEQVEFCEGVEYNFPTFRLRIDERDRSPSPPTMNKLTELRHKKNILDKNDYSPCWPGDWLPLDCPGVRVIALNYTTDPYLWRPVWIRKRNRTSLAERSREMTELLIQKKVGYGHPIVWVGHSKGGLFIKQMIIDAWESGRAASAPLWRSSKAVLFYSVPHRGSPLADFNLPLLRQSIELTEIQKNCQGVLDLHRRFVALYQSGHLKIDVFSFVETALTLMSVLYLRIVGVDSADPGIGEVCGVHLDHREICKPRSRNCILYTALTKMINKVS